MKLSLVVLVFLVLSCVSFPDTRVRSFNGDVYYFEYSKPFPDVVIPNLEDGEGVMLNGEHFAAEREGNYIFLYKLTDTRTGEYFVRRK